MGGVVGWTVDPKLDGVALDCHRARRPPRCAHQERAEHHQLRSRATTAGPDLVLDGELIVGAGRLYDFYRLGNRLAGRPPAGSGRSSSWRSTCCGSTARIYCPPLFRP